MALIKCPNCQKDISNTRKKCIHCGKKIKKTKRKNNLKLYLFKPKIFKFIFIAVLVFLPTLLGIKLYSSYTKPETIIENIDSEENVIIDTWDVYIDNLVISQNNNYYEHEIINEYELTVDFNFESDSLISFEFDIINDGAIDSYIELGVIDMLCDEQRGSICSQIVTFKDSETLEYINLRNLIIEAGTYKTIIMELNDPNTDTITYENINFILSIYFAY